MSDKWTHVILMLLIAAVCFAVFYQTTGFDFVADDWRLIYDQKDFLGNWGSLKAVFTQPFPAETYEPIPYYRPMVTLVNFLNNQFLGKTTFQYHIVNLGFHILNALLLYLLLLILFKRELFSFLAALFFAAHPVHTTSVVWISGRTDLIACFFILLSLLLFYRRKVHVGTPRIVLYWGAVLAFVLALFSKGMALSLPLFLLVWEYVSHRNSVGREASGNEKPAYKALVPFFAAAVLYLVVRISVLGNLGTGQPSVTTGLFQRFLTAFAIYFFYFKKFVFPLYVSFSPRVLTITSLISLKFWGSLIVFAVVLGLGLSLRRVSREISFGILWILVALIPVLNLVPLYASVKEWWAYIPSLGFCLILGRIAEMAVSWEGRLLEIKLPKRRAKMVETEEEGTRDVAPPSSDEESQGESSVVGDTAGVQEETCPSWNRLVIRAGHLFSLLFALILVLYAFRMQSGASMFRKDYFLWRDTSQAAPYDAAANLAFGKILLRKGATRFAKMAFQKAVAADSNSAEARNQFGMALDMTDQSDSAMVQIKAALRLKPDFADAYNNLGILFGKKDEPDSAITAFQKAVEVDPTFFQPWKNIALIYYDRGNYEEAYKYFERALRAAPNEREADGIQGYINQLKVEGWGL
jgi:tetratricopeptide (TPR) repeat protein